MPSNRTKALVILAQKGFHDQELAGTLAGLKKRSIGTTIASTRAGPCEGSQGGAVDADVAFEDVEPKDYDALAVIGGPGSAALAKDDNVLRIARAFSESDKPIGGICHGPYVLAAAGVLRGKQASVWTDNGSDDKLRDYLQKHGATYTGKPVTVDGQCVTADGPSSASAFGDALASAIVA